MPEDNNKTVAQKQRITDSQVDKGRILRQWSFPEYDKHDRGLLWYIVSFGVGGGLMIYAIADGNFLFALIILLFAFITFTHHRREPADLHCTVFERGLQVGDKFFLYRQLSAFAIIYEPPVVKRLYIMPQGAVIRQEISIPLENQDPVELRTVLLEHLNEDIEREKESSSDIMGRVLKL